MNLIDRIRRQPRPTPITQARRDRLVREVARLRVENRTLLGRAENVSVLHAGYKRLVEREVETRAAAYRADKAVAAWMNTVNAARDAEPFGTPPSVPFRCPSPPLKPTPPTPTTPGAAA